MKKNFKAIMATLAVSAVSLFCVGCNPAEKVGGWVDQLFCTHEYNDGEVTKAATCAEVGELTKTCTLCGKTEVEEIEKNEHTEEVITMTAATCTETGLTEGVKCSVCEEIIVAQAEIPALGHIETEGLAREATCLTEGIKPATYCSRCDETLIPHEVIPATGHSPIEVVGTAATCTTEGMTDGLLCANCNEVYSGCETIPLTDHSFGEDYTCIYCGDYDLDQLDLGADTAISSAVSGTKAVDTLFTAADEIPFTAIEFSNGLRLQFLGDVSEPIISFLNNGGTIVFEAEDYFNWIYKDGQYAIIIKAGTYTFTGEDDEYNTEENRGKKFTFTFDENTTVTATEGTVYVHSIEIADTATVAETNVAYVSNKETSDTDDELWIGYY